MATACSFHYARADHGRVNTELSTGRRRNGVVGWRAMMMSTQTLPTQAQRQDSAAAESTSHDHDKAPLAQAPLSQAMCDAITGLRSAVASGGSVLLQGEPGAGHETFARAIHVAASGEYHGVVEELLHTDIGVTARPMVVVDCSRTSEVEVRLFGPDRPDDRSGGSENGVLERVDAGSDLHRAAEGTLLLRHLPELPRRVQARLARVLTDGEVSIISHTDATRSIPLRFKLLATIETSDDDAKVRVLGELLARLSGTVIDVPPLRERRDEIPQLTRAFLADACQALGVPAKTVSQQATELLSALQWRGNIDELKQLVGSLAANVSERTVRLSDVLARVKLDGQTSLFLYGGTLREARERFERDYVAQVLEQHNGRMTEAAKALGIQRTNLYRKVRQLSVRRRRGGRQFS
jgi:DNA-binding NtrC family response regulator